MRRTVAALVVFAFAFIPAEGSDRTVLLEDFGKIVYDDTYRTPDARRTASLLRLLFDQFDFAVPETEIHLEPLMDVEERLAKIEAGPRWRQWLRAWRSKGGLIHGFIDRNAYQDGRLVIYTWQIYDRVTVHEAMHFILASSSGEAAFLNEEQMVLRSTVLFMTSRPYLDWLRDRPWLDRGD